MLDQPATTISEGRSPLRLTPSTWAIVIALPLILGLLETGQLIARNAAAERSVDWVESVLMTMPRWLLYVPLAMGVAWVTTRFPLAIGSLRRSVPVHSCASLAFSALHLAACVVVYGFLIEGMPNRFPFRFGVLVTVYLAIDLLVYWAIAGSWSAVHHDEMARRRELAEAELRSQLSQARLDALQTQLNPHFLFNTLNATIALARLGRQREVVSTLENLGELLQLTLDRRLPREVPLSREIALLERYLDIQLIRFGDRLRVSWEIAPETRNVHVPSMVLLPIVENALQHGIDVQPGAGSIRIRAIVDENALQIEVDDNGPGWRSGPTGHGIGLTNTRSRLEQLYGVASSLECRASEDGGARVVLRIPRRSDEVNATVRENTAAKPVAATRPEIEADRTRHGTEVGARPESEAGAARTLPESLQ